MSLPTATSEGGPRLHSLTPSLSKVAKSNSGVIPHLKMWSPVIIEGLARNSGPTETKKRKTEKGNYEGKKPRSFVYQLGRIV
jgi:hypothetical protein